jgi:hypothetical protein
MKTPIFGPQVSPLRPGRVLPGLVPAPLQSLALVGPAVPVRPLPVRAEVTALIAAGGGFAGSFALAWLLISRLPGVARIL